jgi:tetratricopeptide (TPR) repeat protein
VDRRAPPETLEAMLAPHKAWIEGRAALETLERPGILHARDVFARVLDQVPDQAPAHVGLANACVMQFEMTRVDPAPDRSALALAIAHAREACRLDPRYGEAWATLGFVLDRADQRGDALAASRMAVSLEPDNWRHRLRLAYVGWGEERLREARRTLALLPGFPLAHWLAATVLVARQALDEADRELAHGIEAHGTAHSRFSSIALHWLHGLVLLARGDDEAALRRLDEELAAETTGHLYARECCANAWYAIGAIRWRRGDRDGAVAAFEQTLSRVAVHPLARAALGVLGLHTATADVPSGPVDLAHARAVAAALSGDVAGAVGAIEAALADAPPGSALWTLPVDPILRPRGDERWASALARLRNRAA